MKFSATRIEDIIVRSLTEVLTREESRTLESWLDDDPRNVALYDKLRGGNYLADRLEEYRSVDTEEALQRNMKLLALKGIGKRKRRLWPYAAAVAAVVAAMFIMIPGPQDQAAPPQDPNAVVRPGSHSAELILSDGNVVVLGDQDLTTLTDGEARIDVSGSEANYTAAGGGENCYHTIRTPVGTEYRVVLADGTTVLMNALSELRYPVEFAPDERIVELSGEAYFEVSPDREKPVMVIADGCRTTVVGTSFNIEAYPDDTHINTTLCTGSIFIDDISRGERYAIEPGQALSWDRVSGRGEVRNVNTADATAWVEGSFRFNDTPIEEVFRTLKRWYGIEVMLDDAAKGERFTGKLPRFDQLGVILDIMGQISDVKFRVEGNTVYVKK